MRLARGVVFAGLLALAAAGPALAQVEPPQLSIGDSTVVEGNSGTVPAVFRVWLSHAIDEEVTVKYQTADETATAPSDYLSRGGEVIFEPGATEATITVLVVGDVVPEPTELYLVNLTEATNAEIPLVREPDGRMVPAHGHGWIVDDDVRPPPRRCVVPNVRGKTLRAAKGAIVRRNCSLGRVTRAYSAGVRKGRVIRQRPIPGRRLRAGARVNLVVSRGARL